jgi:U3 small nucleolar RNA-associated protein 6
MAGASDKARFYLEQSIPELKEYERKKIFSLVCAPSASQFGQPDRSQDEINSIARKQSDFEHKINAREGTPSDYARYAEFEINVDSLRRKRVKRLRIRAPMHSGQRRVFFILDRATRKFPGDIGLWMQQIEYARLQMAYKKLSQILTNALRLHPSKPDLWTYAAHVAMDEHADVTEARSYMQRGLRFCKGARSLWLEYMKLEVLYIAKLAARKQILGIEEHLEPQREQQPMDDTNADLENLPQLTVDDRGTSQTEDVNEALLLIMANTPALSGAIPIAIFDAAVVQFKDDDKLCQDFFDIVQNIDSLSCLASVLEHITDHMLRWWPSSWRTVACDIKLSCVGTAVTSPAFPRRFGSSLRKLQEASLQVTSCKGLIDAMRDWLQTFLENDSLDVALRQIMLSTLSRLDVAPEPSQAGIDVKD